MDSVIVNDATMFTFSEIITAIRAKQRGATKTAASWTRLLEVCEYLAQTERDDSEPEILKQDWWLQSIEVSEFRGVSNSAPLTLDFEPLPGVTILHGPNGAGKSSISDALDVVMRGLAREQQGTGGNAALWDPIYVSRGSAAAKIKATLGTGTLQLRLTMEIPHAGDPTWTVVYEDEAGPRSITLGQHWTEAIASHQPVHAYAAIERRVQLSKDLASYFEALLALGGCFAALQDEINARSSDSEEAMRLWQNEWRLAQAELEAIDRDYTRIDSASLAPITQPDLGENPSRWIEANHLETSGAPAETIAPDALEFIKRAAEDYLRHSTKLRTQSSNTLDSLAAPLEYLNHAVDHDAFESEECPVCASRTDWVTTLHQTVERLEVLQALRTACQRALQDMQQTLAHYLAPAILFADESGAPGTTDARAHEAQNLLDALAKAIEQNGNEDLTFVPDAARAVANFALTDDCAGLVANAVAGTDRLHQWRVRRSDATSAFKALWAASGELASSATLWREARKRLEDLRKDLRTKRTNSLSLRSKERVSNLLSDAKLELTGVTVQTTKASVSLVDGAREPVELGMLSAGQRNAMLLAPLLSGADAGPFRFLVLDDPIHAFDELRIDRVAEAVARLAETRRVVVMTHDERFREFLEAYVAAHDTRAVTRDPLTGTVQVAITDTMWGLLLDDAAKVLNLSIQAPGTQLTVTDAVRGLCRQALDNALRQAVVYASAKAARDVKQDLAAIDMQNTTTERLDRAAEMFADKPLWRPGIPSARATCAPFFPGWSQAVHGNLPDTEVTMDEIKAARRACKQLLAAK